jgi:hypothetical protein
MKAIKIKKGAYKYRGCIIEKLEDYANHDWRIFNQKGEWENTFLTLTESKNWLDSKAKYQDMMSYRVGG